MFEKVVLKVKELVLRAGEYYAENKRTRNMRNTRIVVVLILIIAISYDIAYLPNKDFPTDSLIKIESGATLNEISILLDEKNIIKSPIVFTVLVRAMPGNSGVLSGDYYFKESESVLSVAKRLTNGEHGLESVRVTIPEGSTVVEISEILKKRLPAFNKDKFLKLSLNKEGFLFPDTYLFLPNTEPEQAIGVMEDNFSLKMASISDMLDASDYTVNEIITMASILEEEAITKEDKELIAGILWKRMSIGMALQVDAPFIYAIGKNTFELTLEDLKVDSPYNTYKYKGLPPGAISNPGLESIVATLQPRSSPYFFYLSDMTGRMHYSETFEGHKRNKNLYLR